MLIVKLLLSLLMLNLQHLLELLSLKVLQMQLLLGTLSQIPQLQILFKVTMLGFRIKQELINHCQVFVNLQRQIVELPHVLALFQ